MAPFVRTVTARGGRFTYRVISDRDLTHEEAAAQLGEALRDGRLQEPAEGATATLDLTAADSFGFDAPADTLEPACERDSEIESLLSERQTRRKRRLLGFGIPAAVLLAYVVSPYVSLYGLRSALVEKDAEELSDRIDYPAVRESLRSQMNAHLMEQMQDDAAEKDPWKALATFAAGAFLDRLIDMMVTPDGLSNLLAQREGEKTVLGWRDLDHAFFEGLTTFRVERKRVSARFRFVGTGWRLFDVRAPGIDPEKEMNRLATD